MTAPLHRGGTLYICATPQPTDLDQAGYEALVWVEIANVGAVPDFGFSSNFSAYNTLGTAIGAKRKGVSTGADGTLDFARLTGDTGQGLVATAGAPDNNFIYAFKYELGDAPTEDYDGTIYYSRALVAGPMLTGGEVEGNAIHRYTIAQTQKAIVVAPASSNVPTNLTLPSIQGVDTDESTVLTAHPGTWTNHPTQYLYEWQQDTALNGSFAAISGATASTYTIVAGNDGNAIRVEVTAVNPAGAGTPAVSLPTPAAVAD